MPRLTPATARDFALSKVEREFALDPYPDYAVLREHAPVCRQPDGSYVLTRHADIRGVLSEPDLFSADKRIDFRPRFGDSPLYEHHTTSIVFNDPPYHTRVRRLLAPFFAARVLRRMEQSIAGRVDRLLDDAAERGRIDIVSGFALPIPLGLISDLLGVPEEERAPLQGWASLILGALEPVRSAEQLAAGNRAVEEFKAYLRGLVERKRRRPLAPEDVDVLWALIEASAAHGADDGLTELEILHNSIFMLNAGHDTTGSLIANGVDLLFRHPAEAARLRADPTLVKSAVEEMLRFESPLQIANRRALRDCRLGDTAIPAGSFLHLALAAANRDPREFERPEVFDVARDPNRHLAFSHGIHTCAGNALARIEAGVAFSRLLARFPRMRQVEPTVRAERSRFRVVERLVVELEP
jgi:cytochrome P450